MEKNEEKALDAFCAAGPIFREIARGCRANLRQLKKLGKHLKKDLKVLEARREALKGKAEN